MKQIKNFLGFSLMELLIVISIISMMAAFALPSYKKHVVAAKRLEAKVTLSKLAAALEQFYIANHSYSAATLDKLGFPVLTAQGQYELQLSQLSNSSYMIAAKPVATQALEDKNCGTLLVNSLGEASISGQGSIAECWQN